MCQPTTTSCKHSQRKEKPVGHTLLTRFLSLIDFYTFENCVFACFNFYTFTLLHTFKLCMFAIFPKSPAGVTLRCELFDEKEIEEEEYESVVKSDKRAV